MKTKLLIVTTIVTALIIGQAALAHVTVKPGEVGVGAYQTFTISVPSEKELSTVEVRLTLPAGLESVTPTVKSGWQIQVKSHELPDGKHPYEIVWFGGRIPEHFRDEFTFSTKTPATPTTLAWKAHQVYSDGSVVAWELAPGEAQPTKEDGSPDFSTTGPYSQTQVVDDLSVGPTKDLNLSISVAAVLIAIAALAVAFKHRS